MDTLTSEQRSKLMSRIRGKDTKPEMIVRRLLYAMGYRYRLHAKELPGRPDIVFRRRRRAIFVHGCYWHVHEDPLCKRGHAPRSNLNYWDGKLARNMARDAANLASLQEAGWSVLVVWECQVKDEDALRPILIDFLGEE